MMAIDRCVVAGDTSLVSALRQSLGPSGPDIEAALDGESAIRLLSSQGASGLIVADQLTDMRATDVLKRVRERPETRTKPVILVSGRHDEVDRVLAFELGADDFVAKHDQGIVLRRGTWGDLDGLVVEGFTKAGIDIRDGSWDGADGGWDEELVVTNTCLDGNGPNYPVDSEPCTGTDDDDDCNDESEQTDDSYFPESSATDGLATPALNNAEVDPEVGDYSSAASGGVPAPDYSVGNADCMGAFATVMGPGTDWTTGWTAFPEN